MRVHRAGLQQSCRESLSAGTLWRFGERVHYKRSNKGQKEHKIESKWSEGYFLGFHWRTSEAIVGIKDGVIRAGRIRRVGAHRRWDAEGARCCSKGFPGNGTQMQKRCTTSSWCACCQKTKRSNSERPALETGPKTVVPHASQEGRFHREGFSPRVVLALRPYLKEAVRVGNTSERQRPVQAHPQKG